MRARRQQKLCANGVVRYLNCGHTFQLIDQNKLYGVVAKGSLFFLSLMILICKVQPSLADGVGIGPAPERIIIDRGFDDWGDVETIMQRTHVMRSPSTKGRKGAGSRDKVIIIDRLDDAEQSKRVYPLSDIKRHEIFYGVDTTENQIGFYAGGDSWSIGPNFGFNGVRLRAVYGHGNYIYNSKQQVGSSSVDVKFMGEVDFYEALIGYEFRFSGSIFKAYTGLISERHVIDPRDVNNKLAGTNFGAKFLLENWREFSNGQWLSSYASISTSSEFYIAHARYGVPVMGPFAFGIEGGAFGNNEFDALRLGGFLRYNLGDGEIAIAGGVSGDYDQPDAVYGSLQYYKKISGLNDLLHLFDY